MSKRSFAMPKKQKIEKPVPQPKADKKADKAEPAQVPVILNPAPEGDPAHAV